MIPDGSTPIKNEILINILAKGLLSKDEMRIIFYIIRWSWGFDGVGRRQDWTKSLTKIKIANDIGIDKGQFNKVINKMIIENKIIIKDKCYQFNEHYKKWKVDNLSISKKVDKKSIKNGQIINLRLIKNQSKIDNLSISTDLKPLNDKPLPDRKETLKETNTKEKKETISQTSFDKFDKVYQLTMYLEGKIRENNEAVKKRTESQLQNWCKDMSLLINKDKANPDDIKQIIDWVVEDDFWSANILSAKKLRKHYPRFYKKVIDRGKNLENYNWENDPTMEFLKHEKEGE